MAKGISIHIGVSAVDVNSYGNLGTLEGCENDAAAMAKLAESQGFRGLDPDHLDADVPPQVLLNDDADKASIMKLIEAAGKKLHSGDIFLMTYSGHGAQEISENSGDESDGGATGDGLDEYLCPVDKALLDDELRDLWKEFKADVRVVLVTDCCHSGTVADLRMTPSTGLAVAAANADGGGTATLAPPETKTRARPHEKGLSRDESAEVIRRQADVFGRKRKPKPEIKALVIALAACADNETTPDGLPNGAFTTELLKIWDDGKFDGTHQALLDRIREKFEPVRHPNFSVEGPEGERLEEFKKQKAFRLSTDPA